MMKKIISLFLLALCCFYPISKSYAAIGFIANRGTGQVFSFNPDNLSTPATLLFTSPTGVDILTVSPDGTKVYYTDDSSRVYTFPAQGPYVPTIVVSGIPNPVGIAVTSDGSTLYVASDFPAHIYTVPAAGGAATTLTSTGVFIQDPLFLAIAGNTVFVGDFTLNNIFSFPITPSQTSYNATLVQSSLNGLGGLTISNGFLYWSTAYDGGGDWIFRVPLSSPTDAPTLVGVGSGVGLDGLALSCDGATVFVTNQGGGISGIWAIPINQGLPGTATKLTSLGIAAAISVAIGECPVLSGLNVVQKKCDFGLVYEWVNILKWSPNPILTNVLYYQIFRDGVQIATANADTFTYKDNNRKKGDTTQYTVFAVVPGAEVSIGSVKIQ